MRTQQCVCGLLVVVALLGTVCLAPEFTHRETAQHGHDPTGLLTSLASITTSGVAFGAGFEAPAEPGPVPHGAGSNHVAAASQWTAAGPQQEQQMATQPLTPPHKALLPLRARDLAMLLLTIITLFIAAGGGIGGGAVFIVCYVFVGGFTPAQAVALSNITILGGSLANFIANSSRRHPVLDRPLIDWDLILVMEPTTMLGALLGGYLNKLFPVWLTSCLLAALLSLLTYKLLKRGASTFRAETWQKRQQQQQGGEKQQQQGKQRQRWWRSRRAVAQTTAAGADGALAEPLLSSKAEEEGEAAGLGSDAAGRQVVLAKQGYAAATAASSHGGACFDAGVGAGDQHAHYRQTQQQQQQQQHEAAAASALGGPETAVLPVPAGLRPLNVMTQEQALLAEQQQQRATPRSARHSSSMPGSSLLCSPGALHRQQQQQQQQMLVPTLPLSCTSSDSSQVALLLPPYQPWQQQSPAAFSSCCFRRCCSCFDAAKLQLSTVLAYERQQLPWQPLLVLLFLSCWVVVSDTSKAVLVCGSLQYWLVVLSVVPPAVLVVLLVRRWLLAKTAVKESAAAVAAADAAVAAAAYAGSYGMAAPGERCLQYEAASLAPHSAAAAAASHGGSSSKVIGGIHWTPRNSLLYPLLCSTAGVVAGLFGVGGGIVKGPLMLELGVCPEVSAATSATMIMFTAGSAAVVYINFGGVVVDYALALLAVGFFVTLLGQLFTIQLVRALRRRSIIIFMMASLMVLACIAASYQSVVAVGAALDDPRSMWTWGSVCKHH